MTRKKTKQTDSIEEFEEALKNQPGEMYTLKLYVAGLSPRSTRAIANIKEICEKYLKGRYRLEVIDIYQQHTLGKGEQIIAAPTLIKKLPRPLRKFIGDMADTEQILVGLDIKAAKPAPKPPSPE